MKNKLFEIIIAALLVVVLALQVVILVKVYDNPDEKAPIENADVNTNNEETEKKPGTTGEMDLSVVQFDTPYCTILFPSDWMDQMTVDEVEDAGIYSAIFGCDLNGKKGELFTVTFGVEDPQNSIGSIVSKGETVPVSIEMATIDKDAWTEEEYKTVCAMQGAKEKVKESILAHKEIA